MSKLEYRPNILQRLMQKLPASALGAKMFSLFASPLDELVRKLSKGKIPTIAPYVLGTPGVTLFSVGAKSGKTRSTPLLAVPHGEQVILVASNWGKAKHPSWYYNLKANPEVELLYGGQKHAYLAKLVESGPEHEQLWAVACGMYFGFGRYQERTGGRLISLFLLEPR